VIRSEYAELGAEFGRLAAQFGHRIDAALARDIARLADTIECIDRHVDDIACEPSRLRLWEAIVDLLEHGSATSALPAELARATLDIRDVALSRGVLARLVRIVRKEVATSECLRHTRDSRSYVRAVLREGRLTAALALVVAGPECGVAFRRFFFRLGGPANVIDKLKDARIDRARGEIALHPGVAVHARLALAVMVRLPALLASHPRGFQVIGLGLRYLARRPARRPATGETPLSPALGTAA
jgi:hypothetical protein